MGLQASLLQKEVGSSYCPAVTIDTFTKTSAVTPAVIGNDGKDKTKAEEAEKVAMAAEATVT